MAGLVYQSQHGNCVLQRGIIIIMMIMIKRRPAASKQEPKENTHESPSLIYLSRMDHTIDTLLMTFTAIHVLASKE
jgi:hypothetical protein